MASKMAAIKPPSNDLPWKSRWPAMELRINTPKELGFSDLLGRMNSSPASWCHPFEKYAPQKGFIFPKVWGENFQNIWKNQVALTLLRLAWLAYITTCMVWGISITPEAALIDLIDLRGSLNWRIMSCLRRPHLRDWAAKAQIISI